MSDSLHSDPDSVLAEGPPPKLPALAEPTVVWKAGPETAGLLARALVRYSTVRPSQILWEIAFAALIIGLAAKAWGRGTALLALFGVLILAYLRWRQVRQTGDAYERQFASGSFSDGSVLSARFGTESVDIALPAGYSRVHYADLTRVEVRGSVVLLCYPSGAYLTLPRGLFPDPVLAALPAAGLPVRHRSGG
ncbi:hypothetical protein [Nocardia sp. NPDC056100]|uniref:hypothetical protein n=1 Tax=Nocardia sp. NPDC056100 TaxID=3345712 RepID=UPI0035DE00BF